MNCSEFKHLLHDYFQGLSAEDRGRADDHAAACELGCRELLAECLQLTCREFIEFLNDYIDGAIPPDRVARFERHLELCSDCTNYLDSYRKTMALNVIALKDDPTLRRQPPAGLLRAILDARR
jgi:anti-sigma factor RsiW